MPYKISGSINDSARVIVIEESGWTVESNELNSPTSFEALSLASGTKLIIARTTAGEVLAYGNTPPIYYDAPVAGQAGVFMGHYGSGSTGEIIQYITISTLGDAKEFGNLSEGRDENDACSNGTNNRGLSGGGHSDSESTSNVIEYINIMVKGNAADFGDLTQARKNLSATSNKTNDRGVFMDGQEVAGIDYVTISSVSNATAFGDMKIDRWYTASCSNGSNNRGLTAGGADNSTYYNDIDYITISSTGNAVNFGDLIADRRIRTTACSNGTNNRGIFAAGQKSGSGYWNTIEYVTITSASNTTDFGDLSSVRQGAASTSNGVNNRGIIAGGYNETSGIVTTIEYITITSTSNSTNFGDLLYIVSHGGQGATANA